MCLYIVNVVQYIFTVCDFTVNVLHYYYFTAFVVHFMSFTAFVVHFVSFTAFVVQFVSFTAYVVEYVSLQHMLYKWCLYVAKTSLIWNISNSLGMTSWYVRCVTHVTHCAASAVQLQLCPRFPQRRSRPQTFASSHLQRQMPASDLPEWQWHLWGTGCSYNRLGQTLRYLIFTMAATDFTIFKYKINCYEL